MRGFRNLLVAALAVVVAGCASLPPPQDKVPSSAIVDTAATRLGRSAAPYLQGHAGSSGIHAFDEPHDAFAARVLLAGAAEKSIDAQYFIWNGDQVGYLLFEALWNAAGRGVRVRLLLDDANTSGLDPTIAALDAHPNIEVRLYNPFAYRGSRALGYLGDFSRLNRRMHNKSFTADNQVSIVGGRNIANEYFGAGSGIGFADLDVAVIGPIVRAVSGEFDLYWNSESAYPAAAFVGRPGPQGEAALLERFASTRSDPVAVDYLHAVAGAPVLTPLLEQRLELDWVTAQVIHDDPAKTLDTRSRTDVLMFPALVRRIGQPRKSLDIVSPYFVPGDEGTRLLADLARRGVTVRILTNSLASSDESVVHAGYMNRRRDLLRAGVRLYEVKPTATRSSLKVRGRFGSAKVAGLHAKTYAVDGERIFVGSFNFDQRSARLNTEMGLVIDSQRQARRLAATLDAELPEIAYEVRLAADGESLEWIERTPEGGQVRFGFDPETTGFKRMGVELLSILPIEWLL